ncbi:MAG: DUF6982 domain-containing protein, partial [Desulfomonilia bacterium]
YVQDFNPSSPYFHLLDDITPGTIPTLINKSELKALFFVKTFEGNREYRERKSFNEGDQQGQRVEVTFKDGEVLQGSALNYDPQLPGFFLMPVDRYSNNIRIYVVISNVENLHFLELDNKFTNGVKAK